MHSLNITGDTPEALYLNVVKTLSMFLRGPQQTIPVEPGKDASSAGAESQVVEGSNPSGADQKIAPKTRKNAKQKTESVPSDEIPDLGKIIEHDAKEVDGKPAEPTLAGDIIPRLQAIQAACTKRGLSMPECVAYIQKLYGPFGIANAKQLKPESFAEFLEASEAYLKGDA